MQTPVAIVTGAAGKGIGRSTALTLAREGMRVVVNYRSSDREAARIVAHIQNKGGAAMACEADITSAEACDRLVQQTLEQFGTIDVLVIGPGAGWHPATLQKLSAADAMEDAVAELAPFCHLVPRVASVMKENGSGHIIGIGVNLSRPSPAFSYNAAKAARAAYFEQAWGALWQDRITINLVCPGPVAEIKSLEEAIALCEANSERASRSSVSPQDVAEVVAFLSSAKASFITGAQIPVMF